MMGMISRTHIISMIHETTAELRYIESAINAGVPHYRLVRLTDRKWDLEARYAMLLRKANRKAA